MAVRWAYLGCWRTMYPILLQIGDFILPSWHVFFAMAALATGWTFLSLAAADGYQLRPLKLLYVLTYFAGYFGARGFNIIFEEQGFSSRFFTQLLTPGGMTFYGGFLWALLVGLCYVWRCGIDRRSSSADSKPAPKLKLRLIDLALLCGFLGLGIGRIGCFLNGDDYGKVMTTDTWQFMAVSFPKVLDFLPRYPVQLISAAFGCSMFLVGSHFWRKRQYPDGRIAWFAIATYSGFRWAIEFLRGDPRQFFAGYSISQWVSSALLATLLVVALIATMTADNRKTPS